MLPTGLRAVIAILWRQERTAESFRGKKTSRIIRVEVFVWVLGASFSWWAPKSQQPTAPTIQQDGGHPGKVALGRLKMLLVLSH